MPHCYDVLWSSVGRLVFKTCAYIYLTARALRFIGPYPGIINNEGRVTGGGATGDRYPNGNAERHDGRREMGYRGQSERMTMVEHMGGGKQLACGRPCGDY